MFPLSLAPGLAGSYWLSKANTGRGTWALCWIRFSWWRLKPSRRKSVQVLRLLQVRSPHKIT